MLNRVHSRLHGLDDGAGAMGVGRYLLSMPMPFRHNGGHFLGRKLDVIWQISLREHTATRAELHPVRTVLQNLANFLQHRRHAVGDTFVSIVKLGSQVGVIAMAAGTAAHWPRHLHARAGYISAVDAFAQRT